MKFTVPNFDVPLVQKPAPLSDAEKQAYFARIKQLLVERNATLITHYYVDALIQELTDLVGGCVGDSLKMAQFGAASDAQTLVVSGVHFMGETAKILNPEKTVLMPTLEAECSMNLGCPPDLFRKFCQQHVDRTVVVYVNTSAEVKSMADWCVTSSNALEIVQHLADQGEKILWAADRYLGDYVQKQTGADLISWAGSCIVHEEFKAKGIMDLKQRYTDAAVLVHPESPASVIALADVVGSTSKLLNAVIARDEQRFIVATDQGIFYKMQQQAPSKELIIAPTAGNGANCRSCAHCPWMAMNSLALLEKTLIEQNQEVVVPKEIITIAKVPLQRMLDFS